jgi:hypothetical protein
MEKLEHQVKEISEEREVSAKVEGLKREAKDTSQPDRNVGRPRRRIRAYQRIDYWQ